MLVFENRILRKIVSPTLEDGNMNDEAQRRNSPTICKDSDTVEEVEKRGYVGQDTDPRKI